MNTPTLTKDNMTTGAVVLSLVMGGGSFGTVIRDWNAMQQELGAIRSSIKDVQDDQADLTRKYRSQWEKYSDQLQVNQELKERIIRLEARIRP